MAQVKNQAKHVKRYKTATIKEIIAASNQDTAVSNVVFKGNK